MNKWMLSFLEKDGNMNITEDVAKQDFKILALTLGLTFWLGLLLDFAYGEAIVCGLFIYFSINALQRI